MSTPTSGAGGGATGGSIYDQSQYGLNPMGVISKSRTTKLNSAIANVASGAQDMSTYYQQTPTGSPAQLATLPTTPLNGKDPMIYMGPNSYYAFMPASQASGAFFQWDDKTQNAFKSQLQLAGYDASTLTQKNMATLWADYVNLAANKALNGQPVSPWDILKKDIATRESAAAQPRTVTSQMKQYNISTYEDAFGLYQNIAQQLLGRDPTKQETAGFQKILNKYEEAHPNITTYQSTYLGSQLQDKQAIKTTGGVTALAQKTIAEEEAKKDPEYGAYQAATNGMNWLMKMVNGS